MKAMHAQVGDEEAVDEPADEADDEADGDRERDEAGLLGSPASVVVAMSARRERGRQRGQAADGEVEVAHDHDDGLAGRHDDEERDRLEDVDEQVLRVRNVSG